MYSAWIFLWHYERFPLTLAAMLVILLSLMVTYLRLGIGRTSATSTETWMARIPFSLYLGWITVATIANLTVVLDYLHWDRFEISPEIWMGIILATVLAIATLAATTRRDVAYTLVILWALAGIGVKQDAVPAVAIPTWVVFGMVVIILASRLILGKPVRFSTLKIP